MLHADREQDVEKKFSDIRLDRPVGEPERINNSKLSKTTGTPRKEYPANLFPQNNLTNDTLGPKLSTAARAETRKASGKLNYTPTLLPRTPLRSSSGQIKSMSTVKQPLDKRVLSCPVSERAQRVTNISSTFMKATTSSLQKQQQNPFYSPSTNVGQRRSSSTSRRMEYSRQLNQRRAQKWAHDHHEIKPSDITNLNFDVNDRRSNISMDTTDIESPSKSSKLPVIPSDRLTDRDVHRIPVTIRPLSGQAIEKAQNLHSLYSMIFQVQPDLFDVCDDESTYDELPVLDPLYFIHSTSPNENSLNIYEREELLRKKDLYFVSKRTDKNRHVNIKNFAQNFGFDDGNGNYVIIQHDHINFRYEIEEILGNGSFGNVIKCSDHKFKNKQGRFKTVAVKIIKNDLNWSLQSISEIKLLKHLNDNSENKSSILNYYENFHFRDHMCIVTELLSINLYSLIELTRFKGLSLNNIKTFAKKILQGIAYIHLKNIIHCDIKPENIMIKLPSRFDPSQHIEDESLEVKIIDFGSSCFKNEIAYTYIQSRFYRAPEVLLGARYDEKIDIWSFACVLTEVATGQPLLPGKNELEHIGFVLELFGVPRSSLVLQFRRKLMATINKRMSAFSFDTNPIQTQFSKIDEKSIKRTFLYTLFDSNGMINMQFLNYRVCKANEASNGPKRNFKPNSKSLEFHLKLDKYDRTLSLFQPFLRFLNRMFKWDPSERASVNELLEDSFLSDKLE